MPSRPNVVGNSRDGRGVFHVVFEFSGTSRPASDYRSVGEKRIAIIHERLGQLPPNEFSVEAGGIHKKIGTGFASRI